MKKCQQKQQQKKSQKEINGQNKNLRLKRPRRKLHMMQKSGFLDKIGEDFVLENIDAALEKSREILGETSSAINKSAGN